ncbi:hypothetical protein ACFRH4_50200 [Streptomyces mirabilis]|uniref:hypothetical protein n=1 Tax=Streptomyces mirabilis TaxID=68239 RepID=UPI0036C38BD7
MSAEPRQDQFVVPAAGFPKPHWTEPPLPESAPLFVVTATTDGVHLNLQQGQWPSTPDPHSQRFPDLVRSLNIRAWAMGWMQQVFEGPADHSSGHLDGFAAEVLVVPRSERWREAVSTALLGNWCDSLVRTGRLPVTALSALRAEARTLHRQSVPLWRRRTRHGRSLSLDAALGDGLSLYDLVAADVDLLTHTAGGAFEDERLNAVLRGLAPAERQVVVAYAEGEGTTWTEAAAHVGAGAPEAFGERVRRKVKRLAAEQHRRLAQRSTGPAACIAETPQDFLPVGPLPGTER